MPPSRWEPRGEEKQMPMGPEAVPKGKVTVTGRCGIAHTITMYGRSLTGLYFRFSAVLVIQQLFPEVGGKFGLHELSSCTPQPS